MEIKTTEVQSINILDRTINLVDYVGVFSRWMNTIGAIIIFGMVALTFVDVILRYGFNSPI
ncbi:MAG: hypothetical protein PHU23_04260, partial [Dehalococcoidales bacterium]|nr:hypothetical protein [Dehalococcoidales bacterium]